MHWSPSLSIDPGISCPLAGEPRLSQRRWVSWKAGKSSTALSQVGDGNFLECSLPPSLCPWDRNVGVPSMQQTCEPHPHIYYLKFHFGGIGAMKVLQTQMHSFNSPSRPGKVSENESIRILGYVAMAYFKIQLFDGQMISVPKYSELYTHRMAQWISLERAGSKSTEIYRCRMLNRQESNKPRGLAFGSSTSFLLSWTFLLLLYWAWLIRSFSWLLVRWHSSWHEYILFLLSYISVSNFLPPAHWHLFAFWLVTHQLKPRW